MATVNKERPLIVIVGPTASGKTSLAVELAETLDGEIICADSRTVYRGMDIGTAKPTPGERARVPHWGLDLVDPTELFTVADFKEYAASKIADIRARGKTPFLVGGSGLYIDAVVFDYRFGEKSDAIRRALLDSLTLEELHRYCRENDISLPENKYNKRYVVRTIERQGQVSRGKSSPISTSVIVGLATERATLRRRIADRSEQLFTNGVVEEAIMLGKKYGWEYESMTGNIYQLAKLYAQDTYSLEEVIDKFTTLDWQLAKRQMTWFRRNPHIIWLCPSEASRYIKDVLALH